MSLNCTFQKVGVVHFKNGMILEVNLKIKEVLMPLKCLY